MEIMHTELKLLNITWPADMKSLKRVNCKQVLCDNTQNQRVIKETLESSERVH